MTRDDLIENVGGVILICAAIVSISLLASIPGGRDVIAMGFMCIFAMLLISLMIGFLWIVFGENKE